MSARWPLQGRSSRDHGARSVAPCARRLCLAHANTLRCSAAALVYWLALLATPARADETVTVKGVLLFLGGNHHDAMGRLHPDPLQIQIKTPDNEWFALAGPYQEEFRRLVFNSMSGEPMTYSRTVEVVARGRLLGMWVDGGYWLGPQKAKVLVVDRYEILKVDGSEAWHGTLSRGDRGWVLERRGRLGAPQASIERLLLTDKAVFRGAESLCAQSCQFVHYGADYVRDIALDEPLRAGSWYRQVAEAYAGLLLDPGPDPATLPPIARPAGDDQLSCAVEHPQKRWYCSLGRRYSTASLTVPGGVELPNERLDLSLIYTSVYSGDARLAGSLTPQLEITVAWNDDVACRSWSLLSGPIRVIVFFGDERPASQELYPGTRTYRMPLPHTGWFVKPPNPIDGSREISSQFHFDAPYAHPGEYTLTGPGFSWGSKISWLEYVPAQCGVVVTNARLFVDPVVVMTALAEKRARVQTLLTLASAQRTIHGLLLDGSRGALCAVERVASVALLGAAQLRSMQAPANERGMSAFDELAELPSALPEGYFAILDALEQAASDGVLPAGTDPWDWFAQQYASGELQGTCVQSPVQGEPNAEAFAATSGSVNSQGISNAEAYAATKAELVKIRLEAWALVKAASLDSAIAQHSWLLMQF